MSLISYAFLIPLFPLAAFLMTVFLTRHFKGSKISAGVSIAMNALSFGFSVLLLSFLVQSMLTAFIDKRIGPFTNTFQLSFPWIHLSGGVGFPPLHLEIGVLVDPLSSIMAVMVTFVSTLIIIYSVGYMSKDPAFSMFFSYMSLFVSAMLTLVFSNNFLLTFIAWELVGLCSYLLIGFWYTKPSAARAAIKAFVVTRTGDIGFLIGIIALYHATGTFNFSQLANHHLQLLLTGWMSWGIPLLIFCGAVGKSAQFPLHVWLPDAMEGPTPVSALIHAATMVTAGVYLVARSYFLFVGSPIALLTVAWIGGFTAFLAATMAIVQWDSKRVLAYSTVSQLGFMMLALGVGPIGFVAAIFHLLTHAFFKALLFLGAGSVSHPFHDKENPFDMRHYGGLRKKMPHTFWTFLFATLAITGAPFFAGFFSKDEILSAVYHSTLPTHEILWGLAVFTAFLTSAYMFRMFFLIFYGGKEPNPHAHESPTTMVFPLAVLAVFALGAGWIGWPGHSWIEQFFETPYKELNHTPVLPTDWFGIAVGTGVFVLGFGVAKLLYANGVRYASWLENAVVKPFHTFFVRKWYMDDFWNAVLQVLAYRLAGIASWFDTTIVDGSVRSIGSLTGWTGQALRATQTGFVQQYALVILCTVLILGLVLAFGGHWWILRF